MKRFFKINVFVFAVLAVFVFTGCSAATKIEKANLGFYYFNVIDQTAAIALGENSVKEKEGAITLNVPSDANCVEVNVEKFFKENEGVLGKKFTFTRSDVSGEGYAYEQVGSGDENSKWKKYGAADSTAKKMSELAAGPKLFIASKSETGHQSFYFYANNEDREGTTFSPAGKSYKLMFKGNNGKTYKTEIIVKTTP